MGHLLLIPPLLLLTACMVAPSKRESANPMDGGELYEKSCGRCHALYMPRTFTAPEWKYYVRKYGRKARLRKKQRDLVYGYLAENALGTGT
jgi:cytochrome c5